MEKEKTIFWNVDTQYDFMRNDETFRGALAIPGAREIEGNLAKLTEFAEVNEIQVVNTADWHKKESPELAETPDFVNTFPLHCMQYTKGAEFVPATEPKNPYKIFWEQKTLELRQLTAKNIILYKDRFDVFTGNPYTKELLREINPKKAVVYGVATNVCVDCAVKGLLKNQVQVYVPLDAIKELPNLPLPYQEWERRGARLITTKQVLEGRI